jgi:alkanesulfonate monooxygenase SsuD/methylene tetrahydromethanopterin reductase-like flavin-dependent oxidoreductase (luciferase family)
MPALQFGLGLSTSAAPGSDPVSTAVTAERLGFDFVSASDHPCGSNASYETWTLLSWVAARTHTIGICTKVLGVPYRSPAMVAKMAETLDRLSGGPLILGLGGGSADAEFRAFGLPVPSPRDKVDGLEEAIRIAGGLWTEQSFTFEGRLYHTEAAELEPKPRRRIPIWLGTFGPRALAVTGRLADGWIPSLGYAPLEELPGMRERIFAAAHDAGRDPADITLALNLEVRVDDRAMPRQDVVIGDANAVVEQLAGLVELGFTAMNFQPVGDGAADHTEQLERLATEVIPAIREAARPAYS